MIVCFKIFTCLFFFFFFVSFIIALVAAVMSPVFHFTLKLLKGYMFNHSVLFLRTILHSTSYSIVQMLYISPSKIAIGRNQVIPKNGACDIHKLQRLSQTSLNIHAVWSSLPCLFLLTMCIP